MLKKFLNGTMFSMCMDQAAGDGAAAGSGAGVDGKAAGATGGEGGDKGAGGAGPGSGQNTPALAWLPGATTEDIAYVQAKGWDKSTNPAEAIFSSYRNIEKLNGAVAGGKAVVLPDDSTDQKTRDAFYSKLGRPDASDKYSVKGFTGLDDDGVKGLKQAMFDAGLTDKQAAAMEKWNNDAATGYQTKLAEAGAVEVAQQTEALKKEWGAAYEQNIQVGKEAAKQMGWSNDEINGLQAVLGFDGVMKLAHTIGQKVGEGNFVAGDSGRGGGTKGIMAPEAAKRELNNLTNDASFMKAWSDKSHPGHQDAINKKSQLTKWSVGAK